MLPAERESIAAWVGSFFQIMCIRIDDNRLYMTHSILP